jgi:hypothetical protein
MTLKEAEYVRLNRARSRPKIGMQFLLVSPALVQGSTLTSVIEMGRCRKAAPS